MTITTKQLVAHRGYMECYPENSWSGLKAALDLGASWIEFDIQMATEGHFVLLHDADFDRTAGTAVPVFELSKKTLSALSVHEPVRFGKKFCPEPVIGLEEMLIKLRNYPKARAMVEIKEESINYWGLESVLDPLLNQLEPYKEQCVLITFSLEALTYAKSQSDIDLGYVLRHYDDQTINEARELSPRYLICNFTKLPESGSPAAGSWEWMLYDITDPAVIKQWSERGIQLIETRDIGVLLKHPDLTC